MQKATDYSERAKRAADETTKVMEQSYAAASKGAVDFNTKLIDVAQENMNAAFDFARQLSQVKSPSEFMELSTSYAGKQMERLTSYSQKLGRLAQKGMTETAQSLQEGASKITRRT